MTTSNFSRFCLCRNFGAPVQTSWAQIKELMKSAQVKNKCQEIEALDPEEQDFADKKAKLKKQLPAITVHSCHFDNNKRTSENAWWNGLVCLEYDHLTTDEIEEFRQIEPPYAGIILAGKSCSGTGIFMIIQVPNCEYAAMKSTLQAVHEAYSEQMEQRGF